jgi:hypothetical protein
MEQANFFSPVCARRWRESSSERLKRRSQPDTGQPYGRSPTQKARDGLLMTAAAMCMNLSNIGKQCDFEMKANLIKYESNQRLIVKGESCKGN